MIHTYKIKWEQEVAVMVDCQQVNSQDKEVGRANKERVFKEAAV